jgi:hypothetical protein
VAAVHDLQQRQCEYPLELWREGRKVVRLDARPEAAALARGGGSYLMLNGNGAISVA